jgi:hypothetical protein
VLLRAAACGSIDMLVWLQLSSGRPWTAVEMSEMLYEAGTWDHKDAAKWLRAQGAPWLSSFYLYDSAAGEVTDHWHIETVEWALVEGWPWGVWKCEQLLPELSEWEGLPELFAWAHANGCPCTCNTSIASSTV